MVCDVFLFIFCPLTYFQQTSSLKSFLRNRKRNANILKNDIRTNILVLNSNKSNSYDSFLPNDFIIHSLCIRLRKKKAACFHIHGTPIHLIGDYFIKLINLFFFTFFLIFHINVRLFVRSCNEIYDYIQLFLFFFFFFFWKIALHLEFSKWIQLFDERASDKSYGKQIMLKYPVRLHKIHINC